jgi:hypothetical protein
MAMRHFSHFIHKFMKHFMNFLWIVSKTTWKFRPPQYFQVVLETFHALKMLLGQCRSLFFVVWFLWATPMNRWNLHHVMEKNRHFNRDYDRYKIIPIIRPMTADWNTENNREFPKSSWLGRFNPVDVRRYLCSDIQWMQAWWDLSAYHIWKFPWSWLYCIYHFKFSHTASLLFSRRYHKRFQRVDYHTRGSQFNSTLFIETVEISTSWLSQLGANSIQLFSLKLYRCKRVDYHSWKPIQFNSFH